jgi:hypothetical protein
MFHGKLFLKLAKAVKDTAMNFSIPLFLEINIGMTFAWSKDTMIMKDPRTMVVALRFYLSR